MKKKYIVLLCLLGCLLLIAVYKMLSPNLDYETGTDTHDLFGNGQYQLLTSYDSGNERYSLFNMKYHISIIDDVMEYYTVENDVYFYGEHQGHAVYAYLYLPENNIIYCQPEGDVDILYANDMINDGKLELVSNPAAFEEMTGIDI